MATETVTLKVTAQTEDAQNKLKVLAERLENLGGKVSQVGGFLTGAITAPLAGMVAAAVSQSEELQAALLPIQEAFRGVAIELGQALIPLVQEFTPMILEMVRGISGMIQAFNDLDPATKNFVTGLVGLAAAIGPILFTVGQFMQTLGAGVAVVQGLGIAFPGLAAGITGFATAAGTALIPLVPLIAALTALAALIYSIENNTAWKQLKTMWRAGATALFQGGEAGKAEFYKAGSEYGLFGQPAPAAAGGGVTNVYNNYGIDASNPNVARALQPYVNQQLRGNGQR